MITHHPYDGQPPSLGRSPTILRTVTQHLQDGHPPSPGWSPTILSATISRMVAYHSKDGRRPKVLSHQRLSYMEGRLPWRVVFLRRSSSFEGCLSSKVFFHKRCLPSQVIFHQRSSSIKLFYWRSSSIEDHLSSKVVFHWGFSSILSRLLRPSCPEVPPKWIK